MGATKDVAQGARVQQKKIGRTVLVTVVVATVGAGSSNRATAQAPCDADPDGRVYQPRPLGSDSPTYCEGFVRFVDVVGEETQLASLYSGYSPFDASSRDTIWVRWARPDSGGPVHVQARGVPGTPAEGYRMDAIGDSASVAFGWDPEFLDTQMIQAEDVSLLAWFQAVREGVTQAVYVPLRVHQGDAAGADEIVAGVWTNTTLRRANLALFDERDEYRSVLRSDALLAGDVIEFGLPPVPGGYYRAEFSGETRSGVPVSAEFWLLLSAG